MGWEHREQLEAHESQRGFAAKIFTSTFILDYKKGFGGEFGIQTDRKDKSAFDWSESEKIEKHESQKGCLLCFFCFLAFIFYIIAPVFHFFRYI